MRNINDVNKDRTRAQREADEMEQGSVVKVLKLKAIRELDRERQKMLHSGTPVKK